jgi:large subunit ribosomal protein L22
MEARAKHKMARISARKARLVADLVRNKDVNEAITILDNTVKKASPLILKVLNSAIANATENHGMTLENLYISDIQINDGPIIKRFRPRAKGRADRIDKKTSHIKITVSDERKTPKPKKQNPKLTKQVKHQKEKALAQKTEGTK